MSEEFKALLREWCRGHDLAVTMLLDLFQVLHLVDDLTDKDRVVSVQELHQALWKALITLPRNAFYMEHFALLNGTLQTAIMNWHAANRMEVSEAANAKEVAYVLRSSYNDLITVTAWIVGGDDWAQKVAYECRLRASKEGYTQYLQNLDKEQRHSLVEVR